VPQTVLAGPEPQFIISGADVEPQTWEWSVATEAQREEYYRLFARRAGTAWDTQLSRGIGADGAPLFPVIMKYRKRLEQLKTKPGKGWDKGTIAQFAQDKRRIDGPPLTPRRLASRTRRLARMKPEGNRVRGYWVEGWARIIGYHREGIRRKDVGRVVRDVVGLAPTYLKSAVRLATLDWMKTVGDSIRRMSATMLTRLALLKEELADLFDAEDAEYASATPDLARIERIRRRREQVGQMIYRLEMDPLIRGRQGSSSRGWNFAGGSRRTTGGGQQQKPPPFRPVVTPAVLRPGESRILIRRTTRDVMRGS
jgi:hypothetical protein